MSPIRIGLCIPASGVLDLVLCILGAIVMPHNLLLHSTIVRTRIDPTGGRDAARLATLDLIGALIIAALVNATIVLLAASTFHGHDYRDVADLDEAYRLITPVLAAGMAGVVLAIAVLASGTSTRIGQTVIVGFVSLRVRARLRRVLWRCLAIVPALGVLGLCSEHVLGQLLIASQAVLSILIPFAVFPLLRLVRAPTARTARWLTGAWIVACVVVALNSLLLVPFATAI